MVHLIAGTDTYGKVKTVRKTPVVTKFAMLQMLPLYPIQSYYYFRSGKAKKGGVPFLLSTQEATVHGIPLARVDKTSVVMAYLRGIFGLLLTLGSLFFLFVIELYNGNHLDDVQWVMFRVMLGMFIIGVLGGLLTYVVPVISQREQQIRAACGEQLGIAVDPALVTPEHAKSMEEEAGNASMDEGETNPLLTRRDCVQELISVRAWIAQGRDAGHLEERTDELLGRLNHSSSAPNRRKHIF